MLLMSNINQAKARAAINRSRLVVMSSKPEDGELPDISLNQQLSEQLLNLPRSERARSIPQLLETLINQAESDDVVLSDLEILFDRSLATDPMRLLRACSRNKTLLVCWPGDKTSAGLSYGIPSHPEYRTYKASDLSDVIYCDAAAN